MVHNSVPSYSGIGSLNIDDRDVSYNIELECKSSMMCVNRECPDDFKDPFTSSNGAKSSSTERGVFRMRACDAVLTNRNVDSYEMEDEVLSLSSGDDSDDEIPVFVTCDRCNQVFGSHSDASHHENNCSITVDVVLSTPSFMIMRFTDMQSLVQYLIDLGRMVVESDKVYYIPNVDLDNGES